MSNGSCLCGDIKVSYSGEPAGVVACYCLDCRKISGGVGSINFLIPEDQFKVDSGSPMTYEKKTDTGNSMVNHSCPKCGTTLWRDGTKYAGVKILKAGVLDGDALTHVKVNHELFVGRKPDFITAIPGAEQHELTL